MLSAYCVSLPGPWHMRQGVPCQDASRVCLAGGTAVAAVADGLGSEEHSDVAARVAVQAAADHCLRALGAVGAPGPASATGAAGMVAGVGAPDAHAASAGSSAADTPVAGAPDVPAAAAPKGAGGPVAGGLLRGAFQAAWDAVQACARSQGLPLGQMDCTLCVAVFDGRRVAFGNAGDSGLAAALDDGTFRLLTRQDRDEEGRVYPLCFRERWAFGQLDGVASLLLCTDGVLEGIVAPPMLACAGLNPIDTRLTRPFLLPQLGEGGVEELRADAEAYLSDYPSVLLDDDKTVACVFDADRAPALQPAPYYDGPDWEALNASVQQAVRESCALQGAGAGAGSAGRTPKGTGADTEAGGAGAGALSAVCGGASPRTADLPLSDEQLRGTMRDAVALLGAGVITAAAAAAGAGIVAARKVDERCNRDRLGGCPPPPE